MKLPAAELRGVSFYYLENWKKDKKCIDYFVNFIYNRDYAFLCGI